jgi:predicted nucleic acid-binding protein
LGLSRLPAFLRSHGRIAIDTNVFIYQLEANLRYVALTDIVFEWLSKPGSSGVSSTVTMTELLVQPLRRGDSEGAELFYNLLSAYPNLHWLAPDLEVARLAAHYRANYRLKTIDALIAATAVHASATGLITNDAALSRVEALDVLVLDSLL